MSQKAPLADSIQLTKEHIFGSRPNTHLTERDIVIQRFAIVALAAAAGSCLAQTTAQEVLNKMFTHYKGLSGASVSVGMEMHSDDPMISGMLDSIKPSPGYAVKPNLFAFWSQGEGAMGMPSTDLYSDGTTFISAIPSLSAYSSEEAPKDFASLVHTGDDSDSPQSWQMIPGLEMVFALLSNDASQTFGEMFTDIQYEGIKGDENNTYYVINAKQDDGSGTLINLELRINAEGEPWLEAIKPDFSNADTPADFEMLLKFSDWKSIDKPLEKGAFTPDKDWKKVDNVVQALIENMSGGGGQGGGASGAADAPASGAAQGDTAPNFTLARLDGKGDFTLEDYRGKIVVVDFWATWCGPCVASLPTVTSVTKEYADKGVVFVAVNLQEDADHVRDFMKKKGWDFTVALDSDGQIANEFGVTGIPHSVIIDKKGIIREVHVGFSGADKYNKQLHKELDELIGE